MKRTFCTSLLLNLVLHTWGQAGSANEVLETQSEIDLPTVAACAFYSTAKIEHGMVENAHSVFGTELEVVWYGFFAGIEDCHDMTGVNHRRGRSNEIESRFGYGFSWGDFSAKAAYVYKDVRVSDESDTQEFELEFEYETPWVQPFLVLQCDTHEKPGALYGQAGLHRAWELAEGVALVTCGGIGFGNPYHDNWSFARDTWAFRELHLGAELEIELCPHVKLVPSIDFYDAITEAQRKAYDKFNGFIAVAGCHLVCEF